MSEDVLREVDGLLKEREKFAAWLTRLESEKSKATLRAYERVRGDYQQRLDEVTNRLRSHRDAIQSKLRQLEDTIVELNGNRTRSVEELDEARLRRSVGEFRNDGEWNQLESKLVNELQEVDRELDGTRAEVDRLNQIVSLVQGTQQRPQPEPPAAQPAAAQPATPVSRPAPEPKPAPEPQPPAPTVPPAVPKPAAPEPRPEPPAARPLPAPSPEPVKPQPAPEPPAPAPAADADEGFLSLGELVLEDGDLGDLDLTAEAEPAAPPQEAEGDSVGDELAFLESLSLSSSDEEHSFSFLEQHGSGTPQTIICPHCSAANDPAEWYCTECGEELPAE